jgi:uncharacterized membrane protein
MWIIVISSLIGVSIANWIYADLCYNKLYADKPWTVYGLCMFAAFISTNGWFFLIRNIKSPKELVLTNILWDVGATVLCIVFPILLYNVRIDMKTIIGCIIAIIGLIIAKI